MNKDCNEYPVDSQTSFNSDGNCLPKYYLKGNIDRLCFYKLCMSRILVLQPSFIFCTSTMILPQPLSNKCGVMVLFLRISDKTEQNGHLQKQLDKVVKPTTFLLGPQLKWNHTSGWNNCSLKFSLDFVPCSIVEE